MAQVLDASVPFLVAAAILALTIAIASRADARRRNAQAGKRSLIAACVLFGIAALAFVLGVVIRSMNSMPA